jgi:hypothetical protein
MGINNLPNANAYPNGVLNASLNENANTNVNANANASANVNANANFNANTNVNANVNGGNNTNTFTQTNMSGRPGIEATMLNAGGVSQPAQGGYSNASSTQEPENPEQLMQKLLNTMAQFYKQTELNPQTLNPTTTRNKANQESGQETHMGNNPKTLGEVLAQMFTHPQGLLLTATTPTVTPPTAQAGTGNQTPLGTEERKAQTENQFMASFFSSLSQADNPSG